MLQADEPDTYVLATNRTETVRDFVTMAVKAAGMLTSRARKKARSASIGHRQDGGAGESEVLPPGGGRTVDWQPGESQAEAGLGAQDHAGAALPDDGGGGCAGMKGSLVLKLLSGADGFTGLHFAARARTSWARSGRPEGQLDRPG